jgi:anti-sigma factor RsiW
MIDHDTMRDRIDPYADGLLEPPAAAEFERHLEGCADCRAELALLRRVQVAARELPRGIEPSRDLWAGIAARIAEAPRPEHAEPDHGREREEQAERVRVISITEARSRRFAWPRTIGMIAASFLLIAVSSAVTLLLVRGGSEFGAGLAELPAGAAGAEAALVAWEPAEREIVSTVEELELSLELQRDVLAPETVEIVELNLAIIDGAIAEARAALEADPSNEDLTFLLMNVYRKKVDLLQSAVQVSNL